MPAGRNRVEVAYLFSLPPGSRSIRARESDDDTIPLRTNCGIPSSGGLQTAGIEKRAGCHTLPHSFATHLLEDAYDIRPFQDGIEPTILALLRLQNFGRSNAKAILRQFK